MAAAGGAAACSFHDAGSADADANADAGGNALGAEGGCAARGRSDSGGATAEGPQGPVADGQNPGDPAASKDSSAAGGAFEAQRFSAAELAAEGAGAMRDQESVLQIVFDKAASIKTRDGTRLMNRPDLHRFFRDLQQVDPRGAHRVSPKALDKLYDQAIELQRDFRGLSKGLSFWSFKVLLNNVIKELGLGWFGLIELAVGRRDTDPASCDSSAAAAFKSYARTNS